MSCKMYIPGALVWVRLRGAKVPWPAKILCIGETSAIVYVNSDSAEYVSFNSYTIIAISLKNVFYRSTGPWGQCTLLA